MKPARGFALLAVLWVVVALGGLTAGAVAHARDGLTASGRFVLTARSRWAAEACLAVAIARIEERLRQGNSLVVPATDTLLLANGARCTSSAADPGRLVHRNSARDVALRLDSVLAASGDTTAAALESLLTDVGDGRININAAPAAVLQALPGMTTEGVQAILEARRWRQPVTDLGGMLARLPPGARAAALEHYQELVSLVSFNATSLSLSARGWVEDMPGSAAIDVQVVNGGARAAIVRRRVR